MIKFYEPSGESHFGQATITRTTSVNGGLSLTGEVFAGDDVLTGLDYGWWLNFDNEKYVITYKKLSDDTNTIVFDAVQKFFWDFAKVALHSQYTGSHEYTFYLNQLFSGSGYTYQNDVNVPAFEKENWGYKNKLSLFNDIMEQADVEFEVHNETVHIAKQIGSDLTSFVRKGINLSDLTEEMKISDFATYAKGYGAFKDSDDQSKGRLEVEYRSELANRFGDLEMDPIVDERYTVADNLIAELKKQVDATYTVSMTMNIYDLENAGYPNYESPKVGDWILAIDEALNFKRKIRIIELEEQFDVTGKRIGYTATCGDLSIIDQYMNIQGSLDSRVQSIQRSVDDVAISADGKSSNYYGAKEPASADDGDLWFDQSNSDPDKWSIKQWANGRWEQLTLNPGEVDAKVSVAKKAVDADIAAANAELDVAKQDVANLQVNLKANDDTQAQLTKDLAANITLITQNKADVDVALDTVNNNLSQAQADTETAVKNANTAVDNANKAVSDAGFATDIANDAKASAADAHDEASSAAADSKDAKQIAGAVSQSYKTLTDGSTMTVAELESGLAAKLTRTDLDGYSTQTWTQNQIKMTADGLTSKISKVQTNLDNMQVGGTNLYLDTKDITNSNLWVLEETWTKQADKYNGLAVMQTISDWHGLSQYVKVKTGEVYTFSVYARYTSGTGTSSIYWMLNNNPETGHARADISADAKIVNLSDDWQRVSATTTITADGYIRPRIERTDNNDNVLQIAGMKLERGNVATDWSPAHEDMATVVQFTRIEQTLSGVQVTANNAVTQGQLTLLSNQFTSTITDANNAQKSYLFNAAQSFVATKGPSQGPIAQTDLATMQKLRGKRVTISADIEGKNCQFIDGQQHRITFEIEFQFTDGTSQYLDAQHHFTKGESWKGRAAGTYTIQDKEIKAVSGTPLGFVLDGFDYGYVGYPMLVLGSQSADWSPAAFDHSSQITQLQSDVNIRVQKGDVINQINISPESILIAGQKVHITGQTTIDNASIQSAAIANLDAAKITSGSISSDRLATTKLNADNITSGSIAAERIATTALSATNITSGTLDVGKLTVKNLSADMIASGTIDASKITVKNLSASNIIGGELDAGLVNVKNLSASKLTAGTIDANNIDVVNLNASNITTGTITGIDIISQNAQQRVEMYNGTVSVNDGATSTNLSSSGFINYRGANTYYLSFVSQGMSIKADSANKGLNRNAGLELYGNTSYIDFHDSPSATDDYGARIGFSEGDSRKQLRVYNPTGSIVIRSKKDAPINLQGASVNIRNDNNTGWVTAYASTFSSQSAHSLKENFQLIDDNRLLQAVTSTDIVGYNFKGSSQRYCSFVINDDGLSPYYTDPILIDDGGTSFNSTTVTGVMMGAIKALNSKLNDLNTKYEAVVNYNSYLLNSMEEPK